MFREKSRLTEDHRILRIDDLSEFRLFRQHKKLYIGGIICPYDLLTEADRKIIAAFGKEKTSMTDEKSFIKDIAVPKDKSLIPDALYEACQKLRQCFKEATDQAPKEIYVRVNSTYPTKPHRHKPAITFSFNHSGTVCVNQKGQKYTIPPNYIFLIGRQIMHMASPAGTIEDPKLNIVMG